jgi:hypothetical protein
VPGARINHRSTLSRFLAALDQSTVEALRARFQEDLLARKPFPSPGGMFDRRGVQWIVVHVDGTRQAARQRALPQAEPLPIPHRRFDQVCAPGYQGRKQGEVVRTRIVVLQAHTHQFLGTFGGPGNGDYRGELRRAIAVLTSYAAKIGLLPASVLLRLDGLYGDAAPLLDVLTAGLGVLTRSRAYHLLELPVVQQALARTPNQVCTHPESGMTRALYDCPAVPLTPIGPEVRLVVATHDTTTSSPAVGVERDGTVYELFISTLPSPAFTASDVLDLYLHRGSFETVLADEDIEQDSDRWYSHTPSGQEFCQILAQWVWNEAPGTRAEALFVRATRDGICPGIACRASTCNRACFRRRASTLGEANISSDVWSSSMGTSFFHERLSWFSFHPATGWNAALPRRSSALSTRTAPRA